MSALENLFKRGKAYMYYRRGDSNSLNQLLASMAIDRLNRLATRMIEKQKKDGQIPPRLEKTKNVKIGIYYPIYNWLGKLDPFQGPVGQSIDEAIAQVQERCKTSGVKVEISKQTGFDDWEGGMHLSSRPKLCAKFSTANPANG